MTESSLSLGSRIARGAGWMVSLRFVDRSLGFVSTLVLARLLFPEDFGLVAIATAFAGILVTFTEFGFDLALIQNQDAERRHYDTAWTFGVLRNSAIAVILIVAAGPLASAYGDTRLSELIMAFAGIAFVASFTNIGVVEFRKQLVFQKEFVFNFVSRLGGVMTALALAYLWRDYWALVAGVFATRMLRLVLSYALHPYRPRFSLAGWHDIFHFSKWILLNGIFSFTGQRGSTFVLGAMLTPASVGIFAMSDEVANTVTNAFVGPIKRVLFPGYAKLANNREGIKRIFLVSYGVIVLVSTPAAVGIGLTADLTVPLLLGDRWLEAIPIVQVLVGAAFIQALLHVKPILLAINKPGYAAYITLVYNVLLIPTVIVGVSTIGLLGAAWGVVGIRAIELCIHYVVTYRILQVSFDEFWQMVWRSLVACTVMALSVFAVRQIIVLPIDPGLGQQALTLAIVVAAGVVAYSLSILLCWMLSQRPENSAETVILSTLQNLLLKKRTNRQ